MDKYLLRGISIGIIVSTIVFGSMYYSGNEKTPINEKQVDQFLQQEGFKKISIEEYNKLQEKQDKVPPVKKENNQPSQPTVPPKEDITEKTESPKEEKPPKIIYVLTIDTGMYSSEIADALAKAKIIADADEFNQYLVEHDLNTAIQIGTYEVTNEMSIEEIANIITK
ncbi:endolytic transglycosylase MltG [Bacillus timonensis]|uniref:endolytic transglycosylase MltG n=1 Tax=Bacillus timonensis TaxID=1033734 RepID=UPI000288B767|nr:endolytic transglycosylase MltG [Bacillus timonensis]